MSTVPLSLRALAIPPESSEPVEVVGQVEVATAPGRVVDVSLLPPEPPACVEAVQAVEQADLVVLGPGSWFSSVIPHLLVPDLADAVTTTSATRLVLLNLLSATPETEEYSAENLLEVLALYAPRLTVDVVLADACSVPDTAELQRAADTLEAEVVLAPLASDTAADRHDPDRLMAALAALADHGRIPAWR
jgi:uncharacterized cofD-like protein